MKSSTSGSVRFVRMSLERLKNSSGKKVDLNMRRTELKGEEEEEEEEEEGR